MLANTFSFASIPTLATSSSTTSMRLNRRFVAAQPKNWMLLTSLVWLNGQLV
jgi:hypothetical protein